MIKISKEEAMELQKRGFKFAGWNTGSKGVIHRTNTHHRHYLMTESEKALDALIEIRKDY